MLASSKGILTTAYLAFFPLAGEGLGCLTGAVFFLGLSAAILVLFFLALTAAAFFLVLTAAVPCSL